MVGVDAAGLRGGRRRGLAAAGGYRLAVGAMLSVRGKGTCLDRVPSPAADLGRPLARYLRSGRPPGTTGPGAGHRLRHIAAWSSAGAGFAGAGKLLRHTSRRRPLSTPGPTSPRSYHRGATAMASLAAESEAGPLPMQ